MTSNIVITGANGCLGKHLVNYLLSLESYSVYAVMRSPPKHFMHHERLHYLYEDLRCSSFLKETCIDTPVIIHCAALLPRDNQPNEMLKVNVEGTQHVLEWAVNNNAKQFINISSGGVYGYRSDHYFLESEPVFPIGLYGETKWIAEQLVNVYRHHFGLNTVNVRLFFPYGAEYENGIIQLLRSSIKDGKPISIHCGGKPRINPIHIDDTVRAIEKIVAAPEKTGTYNLAGYESISISELTEKISVMMGIDAKIKLTNVQQGDLMAATALFENDYSWKSVITLNQGLMYCKSNQDDKQL